MLNLEKSEKVYISRISETKYLAPLLLYEFDVGNGG